MTLLEICEPVFQFVCRLNRAGRKGAAMDFTATKAEAIDLLETIKTRSAVDGNLKAQCSQIERPLVFFVDSMVERSSLPFARQWGKTRLANQYSELAGEDKFLEMMDDTLKQTGDDANERLAVFYACIGLGFTGFYDDQPEILKQKMDEIAPRIRGHVEGDASARICPEAYDYTDTRNLVEPPTGRVWLMVVLFAICAITALVANMVLFKEAAGKLSNALDKIISQEPYIGQ